MDSLDLQDVLGLLPQDDTLNYYDDRQSPWLLARLMPDSARVGDLRRAPCGKLLDRLGLSRLVAGCGGVLTRRDVATLADADHVENLEGLRQATVETLGDIWSAPWQDYRLTFTSWGLDMNWRNAQVSRAGGSLVVQLGFPSDHAQLMGRYLSDDARAKFEDCYHPVRGDGRPTLAWARVDLDRRTGEALIEEIQCDWLRLVQDHVEWLQDADAQSRELRVHQAYQRALFERYARAWPQVMLLATLHVLSRRLGIRRVFMHTPEAGALLKGISETYPPRSLYSQLPKSFCFMPSAELPHMLRPGPGARLPRFARDRLHRVAQMQARGHAISWRLDLGDGRC